MSGGFFGIFDKFRAAAGARGYVCDSCGKEVFGYPARRLCDSCGKALDRERGGYRCEKCGRRTVTPGICLTCKERNLSFSFAVSAFSYRRKAAVLLNRLKNGGRYLSFFFAEEMADALKKSLAERKKKPVCKEDLFLPVPLSAGRLKERGYNQSAELCKALSALTGAPWEDGILVKARETPPQKSKNRREREENVSGAFRVNKREACRGRRVILVDDVMTTGATGSECSRVLRNAGAEEVIFLTATSLPEQTGMK